MTTRFATALAMICMTGLFSIAPVQARAQALYDSELCATTAAEVRSTPELSQAIDSFGGLPNMFLTWHLAGLAGVFAKTHVTLSDPSGFVVKINNDEQKSVSLCVDQGAPDVLRLHVHGAKNPEFGLFLLKPGQIGESLYGACSKSGWRFLKFKRS